MTHSLYRALCGVLICCPLFNLPASALSHQPADAQPEQRRGAIDLRPKFEKGQQQRYTLELKNTAWGASPPDQTHRAQPAAPDTRSSIEFGLVLRTTDVGELATVDMALETVKLKIEADDMTIEFDSAAPAAADDITASLFRSIVGTTLSLRIDRSGNIRSITGGEALAALGQAGMPGTGGQLFGQIFTVRGTAGFASVGESWETESRIDSGLLNRFTMTTRYTLSRMQGRDAMITMRGRYAPDSEGERRGQATIKESSYGGNYTWDTASGSLKQMDSSLTTIAEVQVGDETVETRTESVVKVTRQR